jgi:glycosyltransferase involved in cell wall biosynthesis
VRVLFATGIFPPDIGGPATYVEALASEMTRRGLSPEVVTYGETGGPPRPFAIHRVSRSRPLPLRYGAYYRAVKRRAAESDVVYLQDPISAGLPGLLGARGAGRPTALKVVSDLAWEIVRDVGLRERGSYAGGASAPLALLRRVQAWVARRADGLIVPSPHLVETVTSWGVRPERIHVVPNAVPPPGPASPASRSRSGFTLVSIGRLLPYKGFDLLLEAVAGLRQAGADVRARIVGTGPSEGDLRGQAVRLGIAEAVELTGAVPHEEIGAQLQTADVFVLLSTHEGLSHVVLEAMQAGVPVVATDVPGNRALIRDGHNGRLVPREVARATAVIRELLSDDAQRRRLAAEARRGVEASWPAFVDQTLGVLEAIRARAVSKSAR